MLEEGKQSWVSEKVFLVWLLATVIACSAFSQTPQLIFETTRIDLGEINDLTKPVVAQFHYCNKGNDTLQLLHVKTASCNSVRFSKNLISPGDCGWIEFQYHASWKSGLFRKQATVYLQSTDSPIPLELTGEVVVEQANKSNNSLKKCP